MKRARLWVADDHVVVRNGLRQIAAATTDLRVIGESNDGPSTLKVAGRKDIDVLLLDLSMPGGGIDLICALIQTQPALRILVLTMNAEPQIAARAIKAGAAGYVTKDADMTVLLDAVRKVAAGANFMEPRIADALLFQRVDTGELPHTMLTHRELEILKRLASAETPAEIARSLGCSAKTISVHKSNLMHKMKFSTNAELFQYAIHHGIGPTALP